MSFEEITIRIVFAIIVGGLIGLERSFRKRGAGVKTNSLVCLGACIYTLVSIIYQSDNYDPGRIASNIVTGIGFIGIGVIFRTKHKVEGLSTAAGLWVVAALGLAIGMGYYLIALFGLFAVLIIYILFLKLEILYEAHTERGVVNRVKRAIKK